MDEKFDAIVVGGGLAGLAAAYAMAQEGLEVILVEKGATCGSKNVTGGKICSHSIEKLFPDFGETAPLEREITKEMISSWRAEGISDAGIDPQHFGLTESRSYTVSRAKLDAWFAEQAEAAGVMMIQGIVVNDLIVREGKVCGIIADGDALEADVVILAEGVNGLLAQSLGMIPELMPEETCIGTKEVIELGEALINERFGLADGEGVEWMAIGDTTDGQYADGFLYTNKDTVSVGVEFLISDIDKTQKSIPELLEDFKALPEIAKLIDGGLLVEYASHLVKKSKSDKIGKLYGEGVLLVGDAAGLVANAGWVVRGMDLAVESGRLAAEAVIRANASGDFSEGSLASYQKAVESSFIAADMKICADYLNQ
ncbi:MAG: electron transfer flavoprotein-quinone oxidoreductase [Clostridiales bacterium]|jgi:electron transfer flavoprotein-quinone oxidoreductase|nr:electron transfer flavoprotein-quinone oxidoreductase [Clostridiales bacterium]